MPTEGKPRPDYDDRAMRKCLTCGELFQSTHRGNRICGKHKTSELKGGPGSKRRPVFQAQYVRDND